MHVAALMLSAGPSVQVLKYHGLICTTTSTRTMVTDPTKDEGNRM